MDKRQKLLTVTIDGIRYRGTYSLVGRELIVEAPGLGKKTADASIVEFTAGRPAHKLASLIFAQLVKAALDCDDPTLNLIVQGSTTRPVFEDMGP